MQSLTEGSLDKIMNGIDVDKPVLQVLDHKKLETMRSGERYRLLVSDGKKMDSFAVLATQLNSMITNNELTQFSICEINGYTISMINNGGKEKRVMVISSIEVKVPGHQVGHKIGNPGNAEPESNSKPALSVQKNGIISFVLLTDALIQKDTTHWSSNNDGRTPITALRPYHNRWVIKARVASKSDVVKWRNSRGAGKLFSMDLVDKSGEIRCTAFRDLCDKFYDMIEVGKVYYLSKATLKPANKQFNNLKNVYQITLTGDSEITLCHDCGDDIPTFQFNFAPISDVEKEEINYLMDVLGVVKSTSDLQMFTSRTTGKEMKKRDVNLVDESNTMVSLTLWGSLAEEFDGSNNPVLAVKGTRVCQYNGGKNLSTISSTVLQLDPDIPEAHRLRGWFNTVGRNEEAKSMSRGLGGGAGGASGPWLTFKEAKDMELGFKGPETYTTKATVSLIRIENALYKSCPTESCKKKMIDQANDMYRCERCDKVYPNFRCRLLVTLCLADWTDQQWVTAFGEEAETILDITARELWELQQNDNEAFLGKFGDATFKSFIFKIRVKSEEFGDEIRLNSTCVNVSPVDYKMYNDYLTTQIKELAGIRKA